MIILELVIVIYFRYYIDDGFKKQKKKKNNKVYPLLTSATVENHYMFSAMNDNNIIYINDLLFLLKDYQTLP